MHSLCHVPLTVQHQLLPLPEYKCAPARSSSSGTRLYEALLTSSHTRPRTVAGDLAVTNFIQGALNYIVPNATLELDARLGKRLPWRSLWNPSPALVERLSQLTGLKRRAWDLLVQSEDVIGPSPVRPAQLLKRLFRAILRGLFIAVFLFLLTWSLSVAIACPIYCGRNIPGTWAPQVRASPPAPVSLACHILADALDARISCLRRNQGIKAIYGGVHALIEIPVASFLIVLGIDVRNHRLGNYDRTASDMHKAIPRLSNGGSRLENAASDDSLSHTPRNA